MVALVSIDLSFGRPGGATSAAFFLSYFRFVEGWKAMHVSACKR
jgi:hypothetical protein